MRHGQRRRTRDIVSWLKKKRRVIRREELLAFLLDKPYSPDSTLPGSTDRPEDPAELELPASFPHSPSHHHPLAFPKPPPPTMISTLSYSPGLPVQIPMSSAPCFSGPLTSSRGKWALFGKEDQALHGDEEVFATRGENGRKRLNCSSSGAFEFSQDLSPVAKRMKI